MQTLLNALLVGLAAQSFGLSHSISGSCAKGVGVAAGYSTLQLNGQSWKPCLTP